MADPPTPKGLKHTARLFCHAANKAYCDGWDAVFGKAPSRSDRDSEPTMFGQCVGGNIVYGTDLKAVMKLADKLKKKAAKAARKVK